MLQKIKKCTQCLLVASIINFNKNVNNIVNLFYKILQLIIKNKKLM